MSFTELLDARDKAHADVVILAKVMVRMKPGVARIDAFRVFEESVEEAIRLDASINAELVEAHKRGL